MVWILLFGAALLVQMVYWVAFYKGFGRVEQAPSPSPLAALPPLSVVVAARNEEAALPVLLEALAQQTHPDVEVIVVDDASEDGTAALVEAWAVTHPNVRLVQVTDPQHPRKKNALTQGIAAATHDLLAFTDADCTPPPMWLSVLATAQAQTPGVLIGYGPLHRQPGLLNAFCRYETMVTAFLAASSVGLGRPYTAAGRNLSYPRAVFEAIGGFAHSQASMSGDDDLLVQEVVRREVAHVRYVLDPQAFVPSAAPQTWRRWLRQKMRHTSAGRYYSRAIQFHLQLFHATSIGLWLAPFFLGWTGVGFLGMKLLVQMAILGRAATRFQARDLLPLLPFWEFLYVLYNLTVAPLGVLLKPKRWR